MHSREPLLHPTPVKQLYPTQMTLGLREVELRRKVWRGREDGERDAFFGSHMVPVILGPGERRYLIDHHHLVRALFDEGVESVFVTVAADLSKVDPDLFWNMMDYHGWTHPFDNKGRRRSYDDLPHTVEDMKDDPYRSLAGELRYVGGFAKDSTPFSEFVWADFLRRRIKPKDVRKDFGSAIDKALALARSEDANYLPGWCAPHGGKLAAKSAAKKVKRPAKRADPDAK